MALMEWKGEYSVGIEELDAQHMDLIRQINKLHEAMKLGRGKSVLGEILEKLINYAYTHFESEEKLFELYNYPDIQEHQLEHEKFKGEVMRFKENFDNNKLSVTIELMNFLRDWLVEHMLGTDMKYKDFLCEKL